MAMSEEQATALERKVRERAKEKKISHFEAVNDLLPETFDYDEEAVLQMWRFQLHPRKQPRNPVMRISRYFAVERPVLGIYVMFGIAGYAVGVLQLFLSGYYMLGSVLALPLLAFWAGAAPDTAKAVYRCFLPFTEHLKRNIDDMRPRFVENCRIQGDTPLEAELNASEQLEQLRSFMLEGADTIKPRRSRALLFIALGLAILIGAYLMVSLFR
jgi:hypothetical protein